MVRIVDTSVAIKWFVIEEGRESALSILAEMVHDPSSFAAPELFFFELAHLFHRLLPQATDEQQNLLGQVFTLGIPRFSLTHELLVAVLRFQRLGLSGYDAAYVALAEDLKGKWLTFDARAHAQISAFNLSELIAS